MSSRYVKPYAKYQKTDAVDAEAICEDESGRECSFSPNIGLGRAVRNVRFRPVPAPPTNLCERRVSAPFEPLEGVAKTPAAGL